MGSGQRQWKWEVVPMFVGLSIAFATPGDAQRSGFVVGFGLGPGHYSVSQAGVNTGTTGLGFDFHIGGVVGSGVEILHFQKGVVSTDGTGVSGVGVALPVGPKFDVHAGVGLGIWLDDSSGTTEANGLGLLAGGRSHLNESGRWMLNFDVMYAAEPMAGTDASVFCFAATINIMSH